MKTLKRGSRGEEVKQLQKKLNLMADGIFGELTYEAVREFQRVNGLKVDGIVGCATWDKLGVKTTTARRKVTEIIVHYTATPQGEDYTVEQVREWHLARGFSDIGYHFLIGRDGKIYKGRDEKIAGAHCTGHNTCSIGVAYVGGCPPRSVKNWNNIGMDTRTPAQKAALLSLLKELKAEYGSGVTIHGHNEFASKPCPGFNAREEYKNL